MVRAKIWEYIQRRFQYLLFNVSYVCFTAMTMAGKVYFDAVSKIGESAAESPVSREFGEYDLLMQTWSAQRATSHFLLDESLSCLGKLSASYFLFLNQSLC